jgi:hypothetical protein
MKRLDFPLGRFAAGEDCLREIDSQRGVYEFGCNPANWKFRDHLKICRIGNGTVDWLADGDVTEEELVMELVTERVLPACEGRLMVSGGHFIPNLRDLGYCGDGALKTLKLSLWAIDQAQSVGMERADLLILIDDLYMMFDDVRLKSSEFNHYRQLLFESLRLPGAMADMIEESHATKSDMEVYFSTEKNLADRFYRHMKARRSRDGRFVGGASVGDGYTDGDWFVRVAGDDLIEVVRERKPNCPAAIAALARDVAAELRNNTVRRRYDCMIGFFPLCSARNVVRGFRVANEVYDEQITSFLVFTTTKCF